MIRFLFLICKITGITYFNSIMHKIWDIRVQYVICTFRCYQLLAFLTVLPSLIIQGNYAKCTIISTFYEKTVNVSVSYVKVYVTAFYGLHHFHFYSDLFLWWCYCFQFWSTSQTFNVRYLWAIFKKLYMALIRTSAIISVM